MIRYISRRLIALRTPVALCKTFRSFAALSSVSSTRDRVEDLFASPERTSKSRISLDKHPDQSNTKLYDLDMTGVDVGEIVSASGSLEAASEWEKSLSAEAFQQLKRIQAEYEVWRHTDPRMPSSLTGEEWKRMLKLDTKKSRIKALLFIQHKAVLKLKQAFEKQAYASERAAVLEKKQAVIADCKHLYYGLGHNTIFHRIDNVDFRFRAAAAIRCNHPRLVLDMSFLENLNAIEQNLTVCQLRDVYAVNTRHKFPFQLQMTGVDRNTDWWRTLTKSYLREMTERYDYFFDIQEKSYLDLHPRGQLVYLTPDARSLLDHFDADKIYVIGAMVDKTNPQSTLARAKEQRIQTAKLPLDKYVKWQMGNKALVLHHVLGILLDVHLHGDWRKAIVDNIPQRKLHGKLNPISSHIGKQHRDRLHRLESMFP